MLTPNRIRSILILIIIFFLAEWFWQHSSEKSQPNIPLQSNQQTHPTTRSLRSVNPAKPIPPAPIHTNPPAVSQLPTLSKPLPTPHDPHKPPPHAVPFELINGWVVAYGDILLGKPTRPDFPKTGFIEEPKLKYWESIEIPFSIHANVANPDRILRVISYFHTYTPIRFVPYAGQPDNIVFVQLEGHCLSYLGKIGGNQPIYLDDRCGEREIAHELMHALGFIHEHSRADRDRYVKVNWSNIEQANQDQFDITPDALNEPLKDRPFDYHSAMLYSSNAFARDRSQPTLQSTTEQAIEPVSNGLSGEDSIRVQLLYGR